MFGQIISIVILVSAMALCPVWLQLTAYTGINDKYFKRIKIRRFKFMFKAIEWQSAAKRGVIIPMLVIQIMGYIFALVAIIVTCIILFVVNNENNMQIVLILNSAMCVLDIIVSIAIYTITAMVSKKREESNYIYQNK